MARARNIKPGFFANDELAECSIAARLLFIGLWTLADRDGRLEDRPIKIKGELFRFDTIDVNPLLSELHNHRFIVRYEADGSKCIQVNNFAKHQNPHPKEQSSDLPPLPCNYMASREKVDTETETYIASSAVSLFPHIDSPILNQDSLNQSSSAAAEVASEPRKSPDANEPAPKARYSAAFESWWLIYPRKVGKQAASSEFGRAVAKIASSRGCPSAEALSWLNSVTEVYRDSPAGKAGEFVPHPETWLRQARYDDDQSEWQRKRGTDGTGNGFGFGGGSAGSSKNAPRYASKRFVEGNGNSGA